MDKEPPRERLSRFIGEDLVPDWRPSRDQWLWALRVVLVLAVLLGILIGRPFKVSLWDWLNLLIVPVVLALGGYLFTRSENRATQAAAERRAQDEALQAYLDQISQLLIDEKRPLHRASPGNNLTTVARARTLTVLPRLDGNRKARVVQFLYESGLIAKHHPILLLEGADLSGVKLNGVDLSGARLIRTNLSDADLHRAKLVGTDLGAANLSNANLYDALLLKTRLVGAVLRKAVLEEANLDDADLRFAITSGAKFKRASLRNANLRNPLSGWFRGMTDEQLGAAWRLEGATMPNGQKYEDWLKSKGSGEDGESNGAS